ncbi:MAG: cytochrome c oxidase accessory protein CcoG [Magnetococcales bacterium]|nr:cytochrome c oxidase accessory protein CcoG [Magnetococcales bacterium]MBF0321355.1 cytochrome c oxidase accessory protein CcoG [Magnetococcales bacterium]
MTQALAKTTQDGWVAEEGGQTLPGESPELYATWRKIYPVYQEGFFRRLKWRVLWILVGIYYAIPVLRWDRGDLLPNQAVLFDLPNRKFYIFDLVIWPQDIFLLAFLLVMMAMGLFFMTTLAGRVFCGYMCFQTVWTDLFLYVEKWIEGSPVRRRRLDQAPWSLAKLSRKLTKHLLWLLISVSTGGVFVFYFADAPVLLRQFVSGTAPMPAWYVLAFLTGTTYLFAGFAREQVCIYMCPYARFQGVMFDRETLIVAYDEDRGEPRLANLRQRRQQERPGDCIDCRACVRVCPTGIDIRAGQQYQCITCAACIDACDEVMDRLHKPHGLIRYTSLQSLQGQKSRILRFRVVVYGAVLLAMVFGITWHLTQRNPSQINVIRQRLPVYVALSDGSIQNNFTVRVLNITNRTRQYALSVVGLPGARLSVATSASRDAHGNPLVTVPAGAAEPFLVYLVQPRERLSPGRAPIEFILTATDDSGNGDRHASLFVRPE